MNDLLHRKMQSRSLSFNLLVHRHIVTECGYDVDSTKL